MTEEEPRRRVAERLRWLSDRIAVDDLDAAAWADVERALDEAARPFPAEPPPLSRFARDHAAHLVAPMAGGPSARHPLATASSGIYPPLDLRFEGDVLVAETRFGTAWEGPPRLVHGGFLAAGFDIVLSAMAHARLGTSVTRWLRVRYLRPTLLGQELRYEVTSEERRERLLTLRGTLLAGGRVTMRAEAEFAALDPARFADRSASGPVEPDAARDAPELG